MTDPIVAFLYRIGSTHDDSSNHSPIATSPNSPYRAKPPRWRLNLTDATELEPFVQRYQAKQHRFYRAAAVRAALGKAAVDVGRMLRGGAELDETQRAELLDACRAMADYMDAGGAG